MHESLSRLRIGRESRNHERQPGLCHDRTCGNAWKLHTECVTINQSFFSTRPEGRVPINNSFSVIWKHKTDAVSHAPAGAFPIMSGLSERGRSLFFLISYGKAECCCVA
jgi:hypothetical protein